MGNRSTMYGPASMVDLRERTEYELWLLEAVYEIVDHRLAVDKADELIYPPSGGPPTQTFYAASHARIGDWRAQFLKVGAPLVFVTAFKLLDMLIEWILGQNGHTSTHRFTQKIAALKASVRFPPIIETRSWLRDRLVGLYERLEPLRGTIIHSRHFTTSNGELQVSSSRAGVIGTAVNISPTDLRNIALVPLLLLRYIEGSWTIDLLSEMYVRRALDEISHLHGLPPLGQLQPAFLTVQVHVPDNDPIRWDVERIRRDVAAKRPNQDVIFELRVIAVPQDGATVSAYLIPWERLQNENSESSWIRAELSAFAVAAPVDMDVAAIARDVWARPTPS